MPQRGIQSLEVLRGSYKDLRADRIATRKKFVKGAIYLALKNSSLKKSRDPTNTTLALLRA